MKNKILIFIMVILMVILGVVVYINCIKTNTTNVDDSYSWILEKIGIQKEYDEIKTEVNQTVEDNGIRITLMDCGYDASKLILCYKVEDLEGKIKAINDKYQSGLEEGVTDTIYDSLYLDGNSKFYTENEIVENPDDNMGKDYILTSIQISDTEFIVYQDIIISEHNWNGTISKVDIDLYSLNVCIGEEEGIRGHWQFSISDLNDKFKEVNCLLVNVNKQIDDKFYIKSIIVENNGIFGKLTKMEFSYDEGSDENYRNYLLRILDHENNLKGEFVLSTAEIGSGGTPQVYKYMSELKNNEKYKILIYNYENYDNIESGKEEAISIIEFEYNESELFKNL